MLTRNRPSRPALLACVAFLAAAPAAGAQVFDEADLFSERARDKAERQVKTIRDRFGKGLAILTIKEAPKEEAKKVNLNDSRMRQEFLAGLLRQRFPKLDGIGVLICEAEPRDVAVVVSESAQQLFSEWNQEKLWQLVVNRVQPDNPYQGAVGSAFNRLKKKRNPDDGLLAAVDYVERKLDWNRPVDQTNWLWGLAAMGGLLGVWAVLGLSTMRSRGQGPSGADDSGRSIAVLGGGIGAVSGQWLFDVLCRRNPSAGVCQPSPPPGEDLSLPHDDGRQDVGGDGHGS